MTRTHTHTHTIERERPRERKGERRLGERWMEKEREEAGREKERGG